MGLRILAVVPSQRLLRLDKRLRLDREVFQQSLFIPPSGARTCLDGDQVPETRQFTLKAPQTQRIS